MSITPTETFGPAQDTANDTTVAYTLAGGESIAAGSFVVLAVGAAGSTTAVPASAADTKGNTYTVDGGIAPSGSVAAGVCSGQIKNALSAGDTITVTLSHTSTDKNLFIDVFTGMATLSAVDLSAPGGLGGSGSTTPALNASPGPTSQAAELAVRLLVWNGSSALTPDANYDAVYAGHFDNGGAGQTKQMSYCRKVYSVVTTPGVADVLAANQPWAVLVVTYKASTAPPASTAKAAARGLSTRDGEKAPSGYDAAYSNLMIDVAWGPPKGMPGATTQTKPLQPADGGALDASELARLDALIDAAVSKGHTVTFRVFAGRFSPAWLMTKVGTFLYTDTASSTPPPAVAIPKFWLAAYLDAWQDFQTKLAAHYDGGNSPTTRQAAVRGIQIAPGMTYYGEPFQRHPGGSGGEKNRAAMVGGGTDWGGTVRTDANCAHFSFAADKAAQKRAIDIHAACWPNTPAHIAFNPWQVLYSQAEAGFTYVGNNQSWLGSDDATLSNTFELIDYMVAKLGPANLVVLENNSWRSSYLKADGTLDTSTKIGKLYQKFLSLPFPRYFQAANDSQIGNFAVAMQGAVTQLLANAVEPTHNGGTSPYTEPELAAWNTKLLANALPGGGATPHAPTNITLPALTVNGGYTPAATITSDLGSWNAGSHAITARSIRWYRKASGTGILTSVRGPTSKSTDQDTDTYTFQAGDLGSTIVSIVTYTNVDGVTSATSLETPVIVTPIAPAPTNTALPAIAPQVPKVGDVLTADAGMWTGSPGVFTYQFLRSTDAGANYSLVQSGSSPQYQTTLVDAGALFEVTVVANNGQDSAPATSAPTGAVVSSPSVIITSPGAASVILAAGTTSYLVQGIATPAAGTTIAAVTVNGVSVSLGADGSFSSTVTLLSGATIVAVIATDVDGGSASDTATIFVPTDAIVVSADGLEIELRLSQRSLS